MNYENRSIFHDVMNQTWWLKLTNVVYQIMYVTFFCIVVMHMFIVFYNMLCSFCK